MTVSLLKIQIQILVNFFFNETNNIKSRRIKYEKKYKKLISFFTFRNITVGGFVNQPIKTSGLTQFTQLLTDLLSNLTSIVIYIVSWVMVMLL